MLANWPECKSALIGLSPILRYALTQSRCDCPDFVLPNSRAFGLPGIRLLQTLTSGFWLDRRKYSVLVAAQRGLRKTRALGQGAALQQLNASDAFLNHVKTDPDQDRLFFLSHRHYLACGLSAPQRIQAALCHYLHEDAQFSVAYADQVYRQTGLILWQAQIDGVQYDIRLQPGNDVLYEGGLSIVLHVNGGRVCVLSFSVVPRAIVLPDGPAGQPDTIAFVTRKQLTQLRDYQAAFNTAFDRCTPAHMCFAALSGIAMAQGQNWAFGIAPDKHPSYTSGLAAQFQRSYGDFWLSLSGRKLSQWGYLIDLPMRLTSLEELDPARRKRALARRAHIDGVLAATLDRITPLLRHSG